MYKGSFVISTNQKVNRTISAAEEESLEPKKSILSSVRTVNFALSTLFFVIINIRINAFPAWFLPWLQWNFSGSENQERNVSLCLDVFGYSYYISLLIAPLPGLLIVAVKKLTKSAKSNAHALNCLLLLVVILSATISTQSTGKDTPIWNAVLMTIEYSFLRTIFFITRSMV